MTDHDAQTELTAPSEVRAKEAGKLTASGTFSSVLVSNMTGLPNGERGMMLGFMSLLLSAACVVLLIAGWCSPVAEKSAGGEDVARSPCHPSEGHAAVRP